VIAITTNADKVAKDLRDYIAETGVADGQAVQMAAKQVTRDLLQMTPPIKSLSPHESFATQRQAGVHAVKRDIGRSFAAVEDLKVMTDPRKPLVYKKVQVALQKGDPALMAALLTKLKYPNVPSDRVIAAATPSLHDGLRRNGRVPAKTLGYFVFDKSSIAALLEMELQAIGHAKGGWMQAAARLGISVPQWIYRHGSPGTVRDTTVQPVDPAFAASNGVLYLYDFASENRLVDLALGRVAASLERQLIAKRKGLWDKKRS
jgi:hypothetical protein